MLQTAQTFISQKLKLQHFLTQNEKKAGVRQTKSQVGLLKQESVGKGQLLSGSMVCPPPNEGKDGPTWVVPIHILL